MTVLFPGPSVGYQGASLRIGAQPDASVALHVQPGVGPSEGVPLTGTSGRRVPLGSDGSAMTTRASFR